MKHISDEERQSQNLVAPENWHTIAFRSYPPYRGTGIMRKFADAVTTVYMNYYPEGRLWTTNVRNNISSIALSEKLGYKIDESLSDEKTVTMIKK